ncbi:uncharacterized protein LOC27206231 [Drosophila simulans]|uniref:GD12642 n=1 Tax=Drosophila simulans TaxID=7240 RepID=B4QJI2_DROSI|nr:uncharacterized protein LOC27206231 [Drosophila simulans]EDX10391.1 GD12642 [Drosophila simulans]KMY99490.1 uncharacterized protein Dsimw501_GD12642 [Drosophila simulans]
MKYFVICVLAGIVLFQAASGFKRRVIYVVPATTTNTTTAPLNATANATATAPEAPEVAYKVVFCSWKNNWCRPASNTVSNCKWGICKFNG